MRTVLKKRWFAVALLAVVLELLVQQLRASHMDALLYQGLEIKDAAAVSVTAGDGPARGIPSAQWREITAGAPHGRGAACNHAAKQENGRGGARPMG